MAAKRKTPRLWSKQVTETSNALDLEPDVFKLDDPAKIAASLKRVLEEAKDELRRLFGREP
jgi:hypothetical protein